MEGGKPPTPPVMSPAHSMEARLGASSDALQPWPGMLGIAPGGRSVSRSVSANHHHMAGSAAGASRMLHRSQSPKCQQPPLPAGPSVDMEPLVQALKEDKAEGNDEATETKVRDAAATIRGSLKNNPENKARLLAAGGIEQLVALLQRRCGSGGSAAGEGGPAGGGATEGEARGADEARGRGGEEDVVVEHCVTALLNMAHSEGVEPIITAKGGIEAIARVLQPPPVSAGAGAGKGGGCGTPAARENAAAALFVLGVSPANRTRIAHAPDAIPGLVHLLRTGSVRGKKDASLALFAVTQDEESVEMVLRAGLVEVLVNLLGAAAAGDTATAGAEQAGGVEDKVMAVVANLCKFACGRDAVHKEGGIAAMVDVIDGGTPRAQEYAAMSLHLLAISNEASFQLILEEGAMPALVKLAQSGTNQAKTNAKALLELLRSHASQNSGSFKFIGSHSQSFSHSTASQGGGGSSSHVHRNLTGELR